MPDDEQLSYNNLFYAFYRIYSTFFLLYLMSWGSFAYVIHVYGAPVMP